MSTFAKLDDKNIVREILVIDQAEIDTGNWGDPSRFVESSETGEFRVRPAAIGFTYSKAYDAFVPPQPPPLPGPSFVFNPETLNWDAPVTEQSSEQPE